MRNTLSILCVLTVISCSSHESGAITEDSKETPPKQTQSVENPQTPTEKPAAANSKEIASIAKNPLTNILLQETEPTVKLKPIELKFEDGNRVEAGALIGQFFEYGDKAAASRMRSSFTKLSAGDWNYYGEQIFEAKFRLKFDLTTHKLLDVTPNGSFNPGRDFVMRHIGISDSGVVQIDGVKLSGFHKPDNGTLIENSIKVLLTKDKEHAVIFQDYSEKIVVYEIKNSKLIGNLERGKVFNSLDEPIIDEVDGRKFVRFLHTNNENVLRPLTEVRIHEIPSLKLHASYPWKDCGFLWWWNQDGFIYQLCGSTVYKIAVSDGSITAGDLPNFPQSEGAYDSAAGYETPQLVTKEKGWVTGLWLFPNGAVEEPVQAKLKSYPTLDKTNYFRTEPHQPLPGARLLRINNGESKERWLEAYSTISGQLLGTYDTKAVLAADEHLIGAATNDGKYVSLKVDSNKPSNRLLVFNASTGTLAFSLRNTRWLSHFSQDSRWLYTRDDNTKAFTLVDLTSHQSISLSADAKIEPLGSLIYVGFDTNKNVLIIFGEKGYVVLKDSKAQPKIPVRPIRKIKESAQILGTKEQILRIFNSSEEQLITKLKEKGNFSPEDQQFLETVFADLRKEISLKQHLDVRHLLSHGQYGIEKAIKTVEDHFLKRFSTSNYKRPEVYPPMQIKNGDCTEEFVTEYMRLINHLTESLLSTLPAAISDPALADTLISRSAAECTAFVKHYGIDNSCSDKKNNGTLSIRAINTLCKSLDDLSTKIKTELNKQK